jgi:translation initiation factor 2B subunit (eIF-2B alpha/beta/delta family)
LASVDELQRAVATKVDELTKEKEELKDKAKAYLNDLTSKHKQEVSEKQEIQKQVLNFLHEIGFDRIPQTFLDIIITNINANPEKHGLQTQIDLENGSL